jgi:hypothetical protein
MLINSPPLAALRSINTFKSSEYPATWGGDGLLKKLAFLYYFSSLCYVTFKYCIILRCWKTLWPSKKEKVGEVIMFKIKMIRGMVDIRRFFILLSFLIAIIFLSVSSNAFAQSIFFVRPGAAGRADGTNWTDAYTKLPDMLMRGAIYYIADGSYGSYNFSQAVSGSTYITVKKATSSDHGTDTGWNSSYGDGRAEFSFIQISTSYILLDGNSAPGYGIYIPHQGQYGIHIISGSSLSNITIRSVSINGTNGPVDTRNVRVWVDNGAASSLIFSHIETYGSGADCFALFKTNDSVFEYCYLHSKRNTDQHGDGFELGGCNNLTIRYSRLNWNDQMIFFRGDFTHGSHKIYGNVFFDQPSVGKGIHSQSGDPVTGPLYVYNNTFVNVYYAINVFSKTTGYFQNNLIYNNTTGNSFGSVAHSYNASNSSISETGFQLISSNPFVSSGSGNFALSKPTNNGVALSSAYTNDINGTIRGEDGVWDRGAFEFRSNASIQPVISPPKGLRIE